MSTEETKPSAEPQAGASAPSEAQTAANNNSEVAVDLDAEAKKAADQVAFYFSDVNLPYDKFLFTTSQLSLSAAQQLSEPGTGWVSLTTVLAFKRMQKFQQALGRDRIAQAIREHKNQFLKVSEDNTKVGRLGPIVQPQSDDSLERSVYVKGFPSEETWTKSGTLQEALEEFARQFGDINVVRMRREGGQGPRDAKEKQKKTFKGSIFIEFKDKASAQKLLEVEPKPTFEGMSEPVVVMPKSEYVEMKSKEKGIPIAKDFQDQVKSGPKKFNAFRDMKQVAKKKAKQEDEEREYTITYHGKTLEVDNQGMLKDPNQLEFQRNTVLRFSNVDEQTFNFRNLKKVLAEVQLPTFVNKEQGDDHGLVGFHEPISDEKLDQIKALDLSQAVEVNEGGIKWEYLSEEDERSYHMDRAAYYAKQEKEKTKGPAQRGGRQSGRGSKRGGRGGGGRNNDRTQENRAKRSLEDGSDEPRSKKAKTENDA